MIQQSYSWVYIQKKKKKNTNFKRHATQCSWQHIYNCQDMEAITCPSTDEWIKMSYMNPGAYCTVLSHSVVSSSLQPHELQPARLLCPWGFSRQVYWSGFPCPPAGDLPNPGAEPKSPAVKADSSPSEPWGKPKNTGAGSLFLIPRIFLTQELNQGLLQCRRILYQLSYQDVTYKSKGILFNCKTEWKFCYLPWMDLGRRVIIMFSEVKSDREILF